MNRTHRAKMALDLLKEAIPRPETELVYDDEYQLLISVILSAQCTDERVNKVTPALFETFPDLRSLAAVEKEDVYPLIKSISYPNNKSRHLVGMARMVLKDFNGKIPNTLNNLIKLPGVGRKTAQVVASVAFNVDALPVDTHVFRVANRIGLTKDADTPLKVERQLKRVIPRKDWSQGHHLLILHGRYTCTARSPGCDRCPLTATCVYHDKLQKRPPAIWGLEPRKGRYYCKSEKRYFDKPAIKKDREGIDQHCCPYCHSMTIFESKSGKTTKQIKDFRV